MYKRQEVAAIEHSAKKQPYLIYLPPQGVLLADMEKQLESLHYMIPCPKCEKRALDASLLPTCQIILRYKCPHCHNIVITPLVAAEKGRGLPMDGS